ncbi:hypothetical protein N7491_002673 [Penicillium cf. griseofulvum]|uniref:Metallo-beta-lactamase domain-containing protein n=1 Tax=Penicillium cf. griseofulvum TaxID=2972120 RepID=A0A9W9MSJ0_9EURO|nr:hypothetical protein N7472_003159 [Penicillium cf. griseofulvum]KAJ5440267.1 hypothetical protein N7491_002673 [Penicillium cf. griseofulvum]KAJ5448316.1 hypothetical protein N7445_003137 [Penicillium cf. griseofulvum]
MAPQKAWEQPGWQEYLSARNSGLPFLPPVTELSTEVVRILGGNPGDMQLQGTNTYLVGSGQTRILIDTGQGCPIWLTTLVNYLDKHQLSISQVLLTHWHTDHTGGLPALLAQYPHLVAAVYKADPDRGQHTIYDGQTFTAHGTTLRALFTPGHSQDHMCFILEESGALFTGDNVLGHGGSVVVEDLGPYMNSLQVMTRSVRNEEITVGYPGHGAVIEDLPAKLIVWSRHWEMREKKVLSVFMKSNAKTRAPLTTREVIACLYGPELEAMAAPFITQVLSKLAGEGKLGLAVTGQERNWFML